MARRVTATRQRGRAKGRRGVNGGVRAARSTQHTAPRPRRAPPSAVPSSSVPTHLLRLSPPSCILPYLHDCRHLHLHTFCLLLRLLRTYTAAAFFHFYASHLPAILYLSLCQQRAASGVDMGGRHDSSVAWRRLSCAHLLFLPIFLLLHASVASSVFLLLLQQLADL